MTEPDLGPDAAAIAAIARSFRQFADQVVARLPLYRRLCDAAAGDPEVCARLLLAAPDQRTPNLLLAAVHDLLLSGTDEVLADWYPSIPGKSRSAEARSRPVAAGADDPWPYFRHLALNDPRVEQSIRTRSTQTNEVGRSAILFPALFQAASEAASAPRGGMRPLGLVEIGSSAGLNLQPGAYGYRYRVPRRGPVDEYTLTAVGPGSRLMLDCDLRGELLPPLPDGPIDVASAVGIDLHPLDLLAPTDARWLQACQWPEETDRFAQLQAAIALAVHHPPTVERGDAIDDLQKHIDRVPPFALPVVVSTWVLTYLPVDRQQALLDLLDHIGAHRDVAMVFSEQPERVPGVPVPPRPDGLDDGRATALVRLEWCDGERTEVRLADHHPHGRWMEWLDSAQARQNPEDDPEP